MADKTQVSLVDDYVAEYQGIQAQMGDPEVAGDQDQFRKLSAQNLTFSCFKSREKDEKVTVSLSRFNELERTSAQMDLFF